MFQIVQQISNVSQMEFKLKFCLFITFVFSVQSFNGRTGVVWSRIAVCVCVCV